MCLRDFPSQVVERHKKPVVEVRSRRELILNPIKLCSKGLLTNSPSRTRFARK